MGGRENHTGATGMDSGRVPRGRLNTGARGCGRPLGARSISAAGPPRDPSTATQGTRLEALSRQDKGPALVCDAAQVPIPGPPVASVSLHGPAVCVRGHRARHRSLRLLTLTQSARLSARTSHREGRPVKHDLYKSGHPLSSGLSLFVACTGEGWTATPCGDARSLPVRVPSRCALLTGRPLPFTIVHTDEHQFTVLRFCWLLRAR